MEAHVCAASMEAEPRDVACLMVAAFLEAPAAEGQGSDWLWV